MVRLKVKVVEVLDLPTDVREVEVIELDTKSYCVQGDTMVVTRLWKIPALQDTSTTLLKAVKLLGRGAS